MKTIAAKLLVLTAIPLLALIMALGVVVKESWQRYVAAQDTDMSMKLAVAAGNLVHALQSERGASGAFVQSRGQKFAEELPKLRAEADSRQQEFKALLENLEQTQQNRSLRSTIDAAQEKLAETARVRAGVMQLSIAGPEAVRHYTETIKRLLDTISALTAGSTDSAIVRKSAAFLALLNAKEHAGQERALMTRVFVANAIEHQEFRAFLEHANRQDAYSRIFLEYAGSDEKAAYKAATEQEATRAVEHMRQLVSSNGVKNDLGIDAGEWFKQATSRIDALHGVESLIARDIIALADDLSVSSRNILATSLVLGTGVVVLALLMGLAIYRKLIGQLGGEPDAAASIANKIAAGDLSAKIELKAGDSHSLMASMKHMSATIQALIADVNMLASAAVEGKLDTRADATKHQGDFRRIVEGVNATLDEIAQLTATPAPTATPQPMAVAA